ncbi:unnamed protein product [Echinostoma caproni]|uniref:Uncharacterized protein n=1 Tax=Echinostoma caproni TaxID=27848 RepID=A0A183A7Z5_9TREM|nr:unnamed protein product [Echinostoma caproni]
MGCSVIADDGNLGGTRHNPGEIELSLPVRPSNKQSGMDEFRWRHGAWCGDKIGWILGAVLLLYTALLISYSQSKEKSQITYCPPERA